MARYSSSTMGRYAGFWLIVTALIELGIAAVLLGLGLAVPVADFGMFLTAAILGVTGLVLLVVGWKVRGSAAANERLLREGAPGTATITGLTQTGMYLNENPQVAIEMMVDIPGRAPYAAKRKEFVPLILLGRLTSGAPLAVRVDRANPQRLVIDWESVGIGAPAPAAGLAGLGGANVVFAAPSATSNAISTSPAVVGAPSTAPASAPAAPLAGLPFGVRASVPREATQQLETMRAWLRQTGAAGTARIDAATDTGVMVGADRLFTVEATLELPGRAPEKLQPIAAMVAPEDVDKVRVGYRVSVRVAPDNHQLIDFDW